MCVGKGYVETPFSAQFWCETKSSLENKVYF